MVALRRYLCRNICCAEDWDALDVIVLFFIHKLGGSSFVDFLSSIEFFGCTMRRHLGKKENCSPEEKDQEE